MYHLPRERTEPTVTLHIQNRGHFSLTKDEKYSFSMSGRAPYRPTDTAMASAASASWIRRDFLNVFRAGK